MTSATRVSFGLPVRNGERGLSTSINSILNQELRDLEVVICDNASTDGTAGICLAFAERDSRVRYFRNERDLGQIENFNRVFELSRGKYFRWIGAGDTLDPAYASKCAAALENDPSAIAVTTLFRFIDREGRAHFQRFDGERISSGSPLRRLDRYLWFQEEDRVLFDPIYSMFCRDALEKSGLLRIDPYTDYLLSLELCMAGRFQHVDECLACRRLPPKESLLDMVRRYHPSLAGRNRGAITRRYLTYANVVLAQERSSWQKAAAIALIFYHRARRGPMRLYLRVRGKLSRLARRKEASEG